MENVLTPPLLSIAWSSQNAVRHETEVKITGSDFFVNKLSFRRKQASITFNYRGLNIIFNLFSFESDMYNKYKSMVMS